MPAKAAEEISKLAAIEIVFINNSLGMKGVIGRNFRNDKG
jgi:hypothetical protein